MEVWQGIFLGIVQGLTEFLPVSSSGHLILFQNIMNIDTANLLLNLVFHMGTLVAVCAVFYKDILDLFKKPYKTMLYLIIATIPAALVGVFLDDVIDSLFITHSLKGVFLAIAFCLTAILLFSAELYAKRRKKQLPLSFKTTLPMGLMQAIAVLPGISRSGSTIAAGTFAGGKAEDLAKFSFLMSIPIILGGFAVEVLKGIRDGEIVTLISMADTSLIWAVVLGFICSAITGLFAIKIMLKAIKKANYKWFSVYLVCIAIVTLVLQFTNIL